MVNKFSDGMDHSKDPTAVSKVGGNRDSGSERQLKAVARTTERAENSSSIFKTISRSPERRLAEFAMVVKSLNSTFESSYALISGAAVFMIDRNRAFNDIDVIVPRSQRVVSTVTPRLESNGFVIILESNGFVEKMKHTETDKVIELTNTSLPITNAQIAQKLEIYSISIENFVLGFPIKVLMDNTKKLEIEHSNETINVITLYPFYQVALKYNLMRIRGDPQNKDENDIKILINNYYRSSSNFLKTEEECISKNHAYIGGIKFRDSISKIMQ